MERFETCEKSGLEQIECAQAGWGRWKAHRKTSQATEADSRLTRGWKQVANFLGDALIEVPPFLPSSSYDASVLAPQRSSVPSKVEQRNGWRTVNSVRRQL